jgi:protein TonB
LSATFHTRAAEQYSGTRTRLSPTASRRAVSFALALAIEILLLLAFFTLNFRERKKPEFEGGRLTTFDISAESEQDRSASPQEQAEINPPARPPRPTLPVPTPEIELPPRPLQMIEVTREEFLASDIAKLGTAANGPSAGRQMASAGGGGDSAQVGTAPNGQPLYAAEWYREPTQTELAAYMPRTMVQGGGWGLIACKTAPRYRVTDCVELGSSTGSRLAGAARQAAWQFLVRPPRKGGRPMIGEWVRIRIEITDGGEDRAN